MCVLGLCVRKVCVYLWMYEYMYLECVYLYLSILDLCAHKALMYVRSMCMYIYVYLDMGVFLFEVYMNEWVDLRT